MTLREKYGEWGFVAGSSVGMGGAFADRLAKEGMNVVVTGRHADTVEKKCRQLEHDFGVQTRGMTLDMGGPDMLQKVEDATKDLEVGVLVYNAGLASMEPFINRDFEYELHRLDVNVKGPLLLSMLFARSMAKRNRGAIILLSSTTAIAGTPYVQTYSATKAYNLTLAEALWGELAELGIDVMAVLPGNTIGQNFTEVPAGTPGFQTGAEVVEEAFEHLGKDPAFISGEHNRAMAGDLFNVEARKAYILAMKKGMDEIRAQYGSGVDN